MQGDSLSRQEAQVRIVPLGYNGTADSDLYVARAQAWGDLTSLISLYRTSTPAPISVAGASAGVQKQNPVRIPEPYSGELTQLYLSFRLRLGIDEPSDRTMWVGFSNPAAGDPSYPIEMDEDTIKRAHASIFGSDAGITAEPGGYIQFTRVNILPMLKRAEQGIGGWRALVFLFDQKPQREYDTDLGFGSSAILNGYELQVFKLEGVIRFKGV